MVSRVSDGAFARFLVGELATACTGVLYRQSATKKARASAEWRDAGLSAGAKEAGQILDE